MHQAANPRSGAPKGPRYRVVGPEVVLRLRGPVRMAYAYTPVALDMVAGMLRDSA